MKFKIGDKVRYIGSSSICSEARQDIGKIGIIISLSDNGFDCKVRLPNCHSPSRDYWGTSTNNIEHVNSGQLMLFEI